MTIEGLIGEISLFQLTARECITYRRYLTICFVFGILHTRLGSKIMQRRVRKRVQTPTRLQPLNQKRNWFPGSTPFDSSLLGSPYKNRILLQRAHHLRSFFIHSRRPRPSPGPRLLPSLLSSGRPHPTDGVASPPSPRTRGDGFWGRAAAAAAARVSKSATAKPLLILSFLSVRALIT
jgi:hypothetical protein